MIPPSEVVPSVVLATAGYDHRIRFWEPASGNCYRLLQYQESQVNKLEISPDKRYLAAAGNPSIRLFDIDTEQAEPVINFDSHTSNVTSIGFKGDGKLLFSSSEDGTVQISDLRAPGCQWKVENNAAVNSVVLHPGETELISGDEHGSIRVWDLKKNSCSLELVPEGDTPIRSLTIMWDASLVVAANNLGNCYVWKLWANESQKTTEFLPLHKLEAHNNCILKCLLSPESFESRRRYLATCSSDATVKIWNVDGFTLESTLKGHQKWVWDCAFAGDGGYLVSASSDTTARLWDLSTGEDIVVYRGHKKAAVCIALHEGLT